MEEHEHQEQKPTESWSGDERRRGPSADYKGDDRRKSASAGEPAIGDSDADEAEGR